MSIELLYDRDMEHKNNAPVAKLENIKIEMKKMILEIIGLCEKLWLKNGDLY